MPVEVGVGVGLDVTDGRMTGAAWPMRESWRASPLPAKSVVQGVDPQGRAVGPYWPVMA